MDQSTLYRDLDPGDIVVIDDGDVTISLEEKTGRRARLKIEAKKNIRVQTIKTRVLVG